MSGASGRAEAAAPLSAGAHAVLPWPVTLVLASFVLLAAVAVWRDLFYFSDGAWFAFAIATGHGWELFWSDWPRRLGALLLYGGPAWLVQAAGGSPWLVGKVYQAGFYAMPLLASAWMLWLLPRSAWGRWLKWMVLSFVVLGLGTFAFGTESWIALPLLWTVLAAIVHPPRDAARQLGAIVAAAVFLYSHELAVLTAPALALALWQSWRSHAGDERARLFLRRVLAYGLVAGLAWTGFMFGFHPDNAMVGLAMQTNPGSIWSFGVLRRPLVTASLLLAATGVALWWRPRLAQRREVQAGIVLCVLVTAVFCWFVDLPGDRYLQRTAIVWTLPFIAFAAVLLPRDPDWKPLAWVVVPALALQLFVHAQSLVRWEAYRAMLTAHPPVAGVVRFDAWYGEVMGSIPRSEGFLWDWTAPYVSVMLSLPADHPPVFVGSGGWYAPMTCRQAEALIPRVEWLAPATREAIVRDVCAKNH